MKKYAILLFLLFSTVNYAQKKLEIYFDFNKATLNQSTNSDLQKWLADNSKIEVYKIYGYCDSVDSKMYNKELSTKRINTILKLLKENNIKLAKNIELKPFGKDFKRSTKQNENRKVLLFFQLNSQNQKPKIESSKKNGLPPADIISRVASEKNTLDSKFKNAKVGEVIKIENIYFQLDSDKIIANSKPLLQELYRIMAQNPKLKIAVHGHICCNSNPSNGILSTQRASVIYAYLLEKGILRNRVSYKGFGSSKPIYKIPEKNEEERLANRRVEILIVDK